MTKTKTTATEPAPPRDYGNGDTWADTGDHAVPPDLRVHYAVAEPRPIEAAGYIQNGADIVEDLTYDMDRVVDAGDADRAPRIVQEPTTVPTFVRLTGASGYRTWLHQIRLRRAQQAKQTADLQYAREARWGTCPICAVRDGTVRAGEAFYAGTRVRVIGCGAHLPVLVEAARAELVTRAADHLLPDGRRVGDVATELVTAQLDSDGAS